MLKKTANVDASYGLSPEELKAKVALSDALIVRSATKVTREVFEASKGRLKVVGRAGVGIDNVDLVAATEKCVDSACPAYLQYGCLVVNAPTANTIAAAEHGIALMCAMARNVAQADASMKAGKWDRNTYVGTSLTGKTVAIVGFGKFSWVLKCTGAPQATVRDTRDILTAGLKLPFSSHDEEAMPDSFLSPPTMHSCLYALRSAARLHAAPRVLAAGSLPTTPLPLLRWPRHWA
eukprot:1149389-Pelagomonas_calceolata.AAC.8